MYYAVKKVCQDNNSIWTTFVAFVASFGLFDIIIGVIQAEVDVQQKSTKGVTRGKQVKKVTLADLAFRVAKALIAYAATTGDEGLKGRVNFSYTKLTRVRDTVGLKRCRVISNEANTVGAAALADYGIDASDLTTLTTLLAAGPGVIASPRVAIVSRKTATGDLQKQFKKADAVLKDKMDGLMERYSVSEPTFYNNYFNARIIVDNDGGSGVPPVPVVPA